MLVSGALAAAAFFLFRFHSENQAYRLRFKDNFSADEQLRLAQEALGRSKQEAEAVAASSNKEREDAARSLAHAKEEHAALCASLAMEYNQAKATYEKLRQEVSLLEENVEDLSFGLYKPHFRFDTTEGYKDALTKAREQQKELTRRKEAAVCAVTWTVGNSQKDGERMSKQYLKLLLRAFNGECDAAVANVSWNNITKMEERIRKAHSALNELGGVMRMSITGAYLESKLNELRLTFEYERKKYEEKEEQRRIREQNREEERERKELEKEQAEAESEEERYQKALERARAEAAQATGAQLQKLTEQVASFEAKLDEARKKKERAIARAQLTKSGFIYVISNIGSFGPKVCKIGMTRRLEPLERVAELGSASVPFGFDVHAMLFSEDAPKLEAALHQFLQHKRINLVNPRKEFYFDVDLSEVEKFVREKGLVAQFINTPEAREFRETLAMRAQNAPQAVSQGEQAFPETLFASSAPAGEARG